MHNLSYIAENFVSWSLQGYIGVLGGGVFWSMIFIGVSAYIYIKNQSIIAWVIVMLIMFAAFGNALVGVDGLMTLFHILIALGLTALVLLFVSKYRR